MGRLTIISRMTVTLKPGQQQGSDPTDLKALTDCFHVAVVEALNPRCPGSRSRGQA